MRETWDIGGRWQARLEAEELQPRLILYRHRRRVYSHHRAENDRRGRPGPGPADRRRLRHRLDRRVIIAAAEEQSALVDEEGGGLHDGL